MKECSRMSSTVEALHEEKNYSTKFRENATLKTIE